MIAISSIRKHVGMSASHNKFMALRWAAMNVVWVRELLSEMGWCGWCGVRRALRTAEQVVLHVEALELAQRRQRVRKRPEPAGPSL